MSHLSTIIQRIKHHEKIPNFLEDDLFWQAIVNTQEYKKAWTDWTLGEEKEADRLYLKYKKFMPERWKKRLEEEVI